ncbi:U3 snoRNP protein [Trebouxia sp. C0010 RCD-2024]
MTVTEASGKRKRTLTTADMEQAAILEQFLFGGGSAAAAGFGTEQDAYVAGDFEAGLPWEEDKQPSAWEDRAPADGGSTGSDDSDQEPVQQAVPSTSRRRPVWDDPDDAAAEINIAAQPRLRKLRQTEGDGIVSGKEFEARLRQQHSKLNPRTSWARVGKKKKANKKRGFGDESDEETGDEAEVDILSGAGALLGRNKQLAAGLIETTRLKDANHQEPSKSVVQSVEFHPAGQLLLTAGFDKRLRLFQVDGIENPKVQSVFFPDTPLHKAAFANDGAQIVASGRRKGFFIYDLAASRVEQVQGILGRQEKSCESFVTCPSGSNPLVAFLGNEGCIPLVSLKSRQSVGTLKMNGTVRTATFTADGQELLTAGGDGVVHTWDLRTRRCIRRQVDEGCLNSTALTCSNSGHLFATGSNSGVVNVYSRLRQPLADRHVSRPQAASPASPLHTFMNLATSIDSLAFSPDTQLLAMGSRMKKDSLRLVHVPSYTVFKNWPTSRTPLGYVHSLCFSPKGGFLAAGNAKGKVLLYRLHHYTEV